MQISKSDRLITVTQMKQSLRDARSATLAVVENRIGQRPNVKSPVADYGRRQGFYRAEYDLLEIGVIEDVESYVRQAFQKKTALMFKEGEKFKGKNKEVINYLRTRLQQIEYVSDISWRHLLRETGYALISRSNFFWVKVRNENASGGRKIGNMAPVAAYFPMGPEYVQIKKDQNGKIIKYRQEMPDGRIKEWNPRDIIHFHAYKKTGFMFGTPSITPVKEDIRALRRIEENVELLIYQTLFPIFQYKVGTENKPAGDIRLPDGSVISEVEYIRGQIEYMPNEGGIVTPERHEIKYVGAEKQALKAKEYLEYFKQRVISGLGISGVDIGEGGTANRATADTMSGAMIDSVKDFQDILEEFINKDVIQELLLESTFGFDVLAEENIVKFKFKEIDIEQQMKKNVNAQVLFNSDILDVNETREIIGYEPLTEEQEEMMYNERVTMKQAREQADTQIEIAKMKPAPAASSSSSTSGSKKQAAAKKSGSNSQRPTNQHGTKTGPQKSRLDYVVRDSFASDQVRALKKDLAEHVARQIINRDWINGLISTTRSTISKRYDKVALSAFRKGATDAKAKSDRVDRFEVLEYPDMRSHLNNQIDRLIRDISGKVHRTLDKKVAIGASRKEIAVDIEDSIERIRYRADFIDRTERMRAYNFGKAVALRDAGYTKAGISQDTECEVCEDLSYEIDLTSLTVDTVPPFHPNSIAKITNGIS